MIIIDSEEEAVDDWVVVEISSLIIVASLEAAVTQILKQTLSISTLGIHRFTY